jgi:GT2 family glycosyltransferase
MSMSGDDAVEARTSDQAAPQEVVPAAQGVGALPDAGSSETDELAAQHRHDAGQAQSLARELADLRRRMDQELVDTRRRLEREVTIQRLNALSLAQELATERELRARMERSRSWRYTRPLHHVRVALRDGFKALRRRWSPDSAAAPAAGVPPRAAQPKLDLVRVLEELRFAEQATPLVSIIIPCYGQYAHTLACLRSIQQHLPSVPIEVIVVEDASGEAEMDRLAAVPGLRYIRRPVNLGFLRSCNAALAEARGAFIHLLNNDTEVTADWLDTLLDLFNARPDCGLVGSRLLYPDGRQQEAGCIVWNDGNASNYGRLDDPRRSIYGYVRRADYCSAASVLLRTDVFRDLGGFDERYLPAYYEDTDLAFRIRERGLEVYYQPESRVVHHEGVSHGTEAASGIKAHQATNRLTFLDRWRATLKAQQYPSGVDAASARDRAHGRRCLLVVDHYVPQPDRDAGSKAIFQLIETYLDMGWDVKFWPDNLHHDTLYTRALQQLGVEVFYGAEYIDGFGAWMHDNSHRIDRVLLSRPHVAANYFADIRRHSAATVMYYGHDLHHVRLAEQRRVQPENLQLAAEEARMKALEESAWAQSDVIYYLSHEEVNFVAARIAANGGSAQVRRAQPYFYDVVDDALPDELARRRGLLFVAGFAHAPNVDAALWFCAEVLPLLRAALPDLELWLVGSNPTPAVQALAAPGVHVTGQVSDGELKAHYAAARVAVAPMRFGAGVKNKVVEAFARGCPLVTTSVGHQGLHELEQASPSADSAAAFAAQTLRLLRDDDAWACARRVGAAFVRSNFSRASMRVSLTLETQP